MTPPPPLPGVLGDLAPLLDHWGYLAVAFLVFVEDFGVPVPGETVMIAAAVYAGTGRLNIVAVAAIAMIAAILGDNVGYAIGRFGGHSLIERYGRYVLLTPARIAKAEAFFTRHGGKVVVAARFIEGLRQANGIIAGLAEMPWRRFLAFNALGAVLWVGAWVTVGDLAGQHLNTLYLAIQRYELYFLAAVAVAAVALTARGLRRRRTHAGPGEGGQDTPVNPPRS
ncbi:DedA family protein [Streptacidiphilus sp. PB12-B1b]|uniref:DedA family protein n=1 Tax=Streptacidiphilus sp. PB12-B1b TaxID=2705012 RepID=UPI0015FC60CE|nr:DedA family protein [Streptacidiphilus sp. PB12-B1b]QMU74714.1 DedA family protein [Streptacidiphilus sp. PB12-B1b]